MTRVAVSPDTDAAFAIRRAVFMVEQGIPEPLEFDATDATATHFLATEAGRPVGTARTYVAGGEGRIGRVAVLADARGRGIGRALVLAAMDHLQAAGVGRARLSAQTRAMGLYERLGFRAEGGVYDDAGIPHRDMVRDL